MIFKNLKNKVIILFVILNMIYITEICSKHCPVNIGNVNVQPEVYFEYNESGRGKKSGTAKPNSCGGQLSVYESDNYWIYYGGSTSPDQVTTTHSDRWTVAYYNPADRTNRYTNYDLGVSC